MRITLIIRQLFSFILAFWVAVLGRFSFNSMLVGVEVTRLEFCWWSTCFESERGHQVLWRRWFPLSPISPSVQAPG